MNLRTALCLSILVTAGCAETLEVPPAGGPEETDNTVSDVTSEAGFLCADLDCQADASTGWAQLESGNYKLAYESFKCGDTVGAAYGAALSLLLALPETDAVTATVARLGYGPLSANDFTGVGSLAEQNGRYWSASGNIRIASDNGDAVEIELPMTHIDWDDGLNIEGSRDTLDTSYDLNLEIFEFNPSGDGDVFELRTHCEEAVAGVGDDSMYGEEMYIDVRMMNDDIDLNCYFGIGALVDAGCEAATGRIVVAEVGSDVTPAVIQLEDIPIQCGDWSSSSLTTWTGTLSGEITGPATFRDFDLSGYHPLLQDDDAFWDALPLDITVNDLVSDAEPLIEYFERIGCYASNADNGGAGSVFVIPKSLNGRADMPVSTSDALLTAGAAYAAAAGLAIGNSYDFDLHFRQLDDMTVAEQAEEINGNVPTLKSDHRFEEARELLERSLDLLAQGLETVYPDGIFVDDASVRGREDLYNWASAALESLREGEVTVPESDPPITVNLKAVFDNPPDPSQLEMDPVVVEVDEWDYEYLEEVESWFQALAGDVIPAFDFDMEDNSLFYDPEEWIEDYFELTILNSCDLVGCYL